MATTDRQPRDRHDRTTLAVAALGVVIGVCALGVTSCQVQIIKNNARQQMRAYVYLTLLISKYPPTKPDRLGIGVEISNSGLTWARNLAIRKTKIPRDLTAEDYEPWTRAKWDADEPPIVLGPRQTLPLQLTEIWLIEVPDIVEGRKGYDFAVWVTYNDTFTDARHQTRLAQRFAADKDGGYALGYVGTNNCADDDCPEK
jgi:hypothetical protein